MRRCRWFLLVPFWVLAASAAQTTVSFDSLFTGPGQNVHDAAVSVAAVSFNNDYTDWGGGYESWSGFAFSTVSNVTDGSFLNQYAAAQALPRAYAVAYHDSWNPAPEISFAVPAAPKSVRINLTTYAAETIRNGDIYG